MSDARLSEQFLAAVNTRARGISAESEFQAWVMLKAPEIGMLEDRLAAAIEENEGLRHDYHELLYAVATKYESETRHETALRYMRQSEERSMGDGMPTAALAQEEPR